MSDSCAFTSEIIKKIRCSKITSKIRQKIKIGFFEKFRFKTEYIDLLSLKLPKGTDENSFMAHREYIHFSLLLDKRSARNYCSDRRFFYERCADLAGREILVLENASKADIEAFIKRNPRFVGKVNCKSTGAGFCTYDSSKYESTNSLIDKIIENKQEFLEGFIFQHDILSEIYPGSVNTLRIHTVNVGGTVNTFFKPKLRIGGGGSETDVSTGKGAMRAACEIDGTISMPCRITYDNYILKSNVHPDTGTDLREIKIPFVKESLNLCIEGAARFPEVPYMAWDVAVTNAGPVLVEANGISGCFNTYQAMNVLYNKKGLRKELLEMFEFAGVDTKQNGKKT